MNKFTTAVKTFVADENGVTAIEYGLIAALVGIAMAAGADTLGKKLDEAFRYVAGKMVTGPATP